MLSRFPLLEYLPDVSLWGDIERLPERDKHVAVRRIVERCPRLMRLGHWNPKQKGLVDMALMGHGNGKVTWMEEARLGPEF